MAAKTQCKFFVVRYAPDAVKNEFVNIGLVLMPPAGGAQIRFTDDWSRVRCLDPEADLEVLQALADSTSVALENAQLYRDRLRQDLLANRRQVDAQYRAVPDHGAAADDQFADMPRRRP